MTQAWMLPLLFGVVPVCFAAEGGAHTLGATRSEVHTIILHTISGPSCTADRVVYSGASGNAERWKRFFDNHPFLGVHYVIDREGRVASSTPENRTANHALSNNDGTIGIELVHNGDGEEPFGDKQINALIEIIRSIRTRHNIPIENIKSHAEVDVRTFRCGGRIVKSRVDPGSNFPWAKLRAAIDEPTLLIRPTPAKRLDPPHR